MPFTLPLEEIESLLVQNSISIKTQNGTFWKVRRNGATKQSKSAFKIPIKAGLWLYSYLTEKTTFCKPGDGNSTAQFLVHTMCPSNPTYLEGTPK